MHQVIEPPGVRRATRFLFLLFAGIGSVASIAIVRDGGGVFGVLFGSMFIGIPWIIHRASRGPGVPGFALSSDGILGAADDEHRHIAWGEVDHLAWQGTGLEVNGQACLALHAELTDGRSVRITTYTARRGKEVDEIVEQVRSSGALPSRVTFGPGVAPRSDARPDTHSPADALAGDPQATVKNWSGLPPAMKVVVGLVVVAFLAPILMMFAVVPIMVNAFGGPIGWVVVGAFIAATTAGLLRTLGRGRTSLLTCSFTAEGVVADDGIGLTIPWREGSELRVEPLPTGGGSLVEGGSRQGWLLHLHQPGSSPVQLAPTLTSRFGVQRAVAELATAKKHGLIPADVPLVLAGDLASDVTRKLTALWDAPLG